MSTPISMYEITVTETKQGVPHAPVFVGDLKLYSFPGGYKFELVEDFGFQFCWDMDKKCVIESPYVCNFRTVDLVALEGFGTDLISSPRSLWSLFPPFGSGLRASVIHDLLYRHDVPNPSGDFFNQKQADQIFRLGLIADGVSKRKTMAMYSALRLMGCRAWEENRQS